MELRIKQWPPRDSTHLAGHDPGWKYKILKAPVETIARILFRPRYRGTENIELLGDTPAILVSNHDTGLDPAYISPKYRYKIHTLALDNPWWDSKLLRYVYRELGVIAVPPSGSKKETYDISYRALKRGYTLLIFPEANFMHDKRVIYGKLGFARLAAHTGCPILPIGISGIDHVHFKDFLPPLNRKVAVEFRPPRKVMKDFRSSYPDLINRNTEVGIRDEVMHEVRMASNYAGILPRDRDELIAYYKGLKYRYTDIWSP